VRKSNYLLLFSTNMIVFCHSVSAFESASHDYKLSKPFSASSSYILQAIMTVIFSWLLLWFSSESSSVTIYVLRFQLTTSNPHILFLQTIDVFAEKMWIAVSLTYLICEHFEAEKKVENDMTLCNAWSLTRTLISAVYTLPESFTLHLLLLNKTHQAVMMCSLSS
jgi:hypothetical protein